MGKTGGLKEHTPASEGLPRFCEGRVCVGREAGGGTARTSSRKARNQFSRCTHLSRKRLGKKHRMGGFEDSSLGGCFFLFVFLSFAVNTYCFSTQDDSFLFFTLGK